MIGSRGFFGGGDDQSSTQAQQSERQDQQRASNYGEKRLQLIIPVTIKMFKPQYSLEQELPSDALVVLGRVVGYNDEGLRVKLTVCDDTGTQEFLVTKKNDNLPAYMEGFHSGENSYVEVTFTKRKFKDEDVCYVNYLRQIEDYNEISRHRIEVVLRYLQRTQGYIDKDKGQQQGINNNQGQNFNNNNMMRGNNNLVNNNSFQQNFNQNQGFNQNFNQNQPRNQIQPQINQNHKAATMQPDQRVLACVQYLASNSDDQMFTTQAVVQELRQFLQMGQINKILQELLANNTIYETGEKDTYRCML